MTTPRWAQTLLRRVAPSGRVEDVLGDLEETHRARVERRGPMVGTFLTGFEALDIAATLVRERVRRRRRASRSSAPNDPTTRSGRMFWVSWLDIKLGLRMLGKYPGLSVVGGLGMAVAIAISAGFFAFFYSHLYPRIPLDEGDRLVGLENWHVVNNNEFRQSLHDFVSWREQMQSVEDIGAFRNVTRNLFISGGTAQVVRIAQMTASGFRAARVPPLHGRFLLDEDEQAGAPPVIVIAHDVWQTHFLGDREVVGREVRVGGTVHTVVGIMPEGFAFPMNHHFWTPLQFDPADWERGGGPQIFIFGRLLPGVTIDQAKAELTAIGRQSAAAFPESHEQLRPQVLPYTYPLIDIQDVSVWQINLMLLFVSLLLVVVAMNVAVLAYARTATRRGEIAVRTALGASRRRIVGQLFVEALVLSGVAAVVGLLLARVGLRQANLIMEQETAEVPFWVDYGLSSGTVIYIVGLAILGAVIVGVLPALQATGRGFQSSLHQVSSGTGMRLGKTWTVLIVAQVAIAVSTLPAAVAMGWNEIRNATTVPTFPSNEFLLARLAMDWEPLPGADVEAHRQEFAVRYRDFNAEFMRRLMRETGVSDVTFSTSIPGSGSRASIEVEGLAIPVETPSGHPVRSSRVDVDYFGAFDVPVLSGRPFHTGDLGDDATAVIVNRTFVQRILSAGNAIGQRIRYVEETDAASDGAEVVRWYEIVGVVSDLDANAIDPDLVHATAYHPLAADDARLLTVRTRGGMPPGIAERLQGVATTLDPNLRLNIRTLDELDRQEEIALRLVALIVGLVLVSVLLLSAAGIYALMSFTVTQRRREIGIRTALGAHRHRLLGSIFARALWQLALGVVVGVAATSLLDVSTGGELLGGEGTVLVPAVAVLMIAVGLLAVVGPARRGLGIEPTEALRTE